jgi:ribonuclease-3
LDNSFHKLQRLNEILGSPFENLDSLALAVKHRSAGIRNNERMEFLGDAILGFVIAEELYNRFSTAREGQLSRLRAKLVKRETLALMAREFQLGDFLEMGQGELKSGGYNRDSILSDAFEAIVAAIYLDCGLDVARERLLTWFGRRLSELSLGDLQKDAKTRLQEYLQSSGSGLPIYTITATEGEAHDQVFHVECKVSLLKESVKGSALSRKRAEQNAAKVALDMLEKLSISGT